ncbi:MAG: signal peptidase I [Syntrophomonadaceae bacterium]|nr:signal peptidase I [Syntrophomonadaceae bacterium]
MNSDTVGNPNESTVFKKALSVIGITICIFLTMIIIVNGTMIVKSYLYPDDIPDFMGYKPFIVLSGSMEPTILTGDIVLTKETNADSIMKGDIITFRADKNTVVTHRVTEVVTENGTRSFLTKGDANTGADASSVKAETLEGKYLGRVGGVGRFAMFLQTPMGMLLFVVTPLCLFIVYDITSRSRRNKKKGSREAELEAELAALKAARQENNESEAKEENLPG